ncbi:hypothetical protein D3C76_1713880 [compost metagenome]
MLLPKFVDIDAVVVLLEYPLTFGHLLQHVYKDTLGVFLSFANLHLRDTLEHIQVVNLVIKHLNTYITACCMQQHGRYKSY